MYTKIIHCFKMCNSPVFMYMGVNTGLFQKTLKICTRCGISFDDFSEIFCDCGSKLEYIVTNDIKILENGMKILGEDEDEDDEMSEFHFSDYESEEESEDTSDYYDSDNCRCWGW